MKVVTKKLGREGLWGQAHSDEKVIELDPRLKGRKHLEILIHEALHLLNWEWSEAKVIRQSKKLSQVIWKANYRRCELENPKQE